MGCATKSVRELGDLNPNLRDLDETGRLQFFYHSPRSKLPVRDVMGDQGHCDKTEPHIERNAENFCNKCWQQNIRGFVEGPQKYLFLFTRCMNRQMKQFGKLFVVGYIVKEDCKFRPGRFYAVSGRTRLYSFENAFRLRNANPRHAQRILGGAKTRRMLDHFDGRKNIRKECVERIRKLKRQLRERERRKQPRQCR